MPKKKNYKLIKGKTPLLLSAPHTHRHKRPNLENRIKQSEPWTKYIAKAIAENTNSYCIYSIQKQEKDPNYYPLKENPYKKEIKKLADKNQIKYLIDIHGLSDKHQYDFGIFYQKRFRNSKKLAYAIAEELNKERLRKCLIHILHFKQNDQETIAEFGAEQLKIPSIQIEIARYIREDDILRENFIKLITKWVDF